MAYVDETFQQPTKQFPNGFYSLCGVVLQGNHILSMQDELCSIVGGHYWHATEALRDGNTQTFLDILDHMHTHPTMNVFVTTSEVHGSSARALEDARHDVLSRLVIDLSQSDHSFRGVIMEQQNTRSKTQADAALIARLRQNSLIPSDFALKSVSPTTDPNLWLPDTAAMAYRRTITHPHHESSRWFGQYLRQFSFVTVLPEDTPADPRVLPRFVEELKAIQNDPNAMKNTSSGQVAPGPAGFLQRQARQQPIQQRIERQLASRDRSDLPPEALTPQERLALQLGSNTPAPNVRSKPIEDMTPGERLAAQFGSNTPASAASKPIEQMTPGERLALQLGMQQQQTSPGNDEYTPTQEYESGSSSGLEL